MNTTPLTKESEIRELLTQYPDLGYRGWRSPGTSEPQHQEARELLIQAVPAVELCRRVFRDPRFGQEYRGLKSAYYLKHVVEAWDFARAPRLRDVRRLLQLEQHQPSRQVYNGIYVPESAAVSAALLEGFDATRRHPEAPTSTIVVPG